MNSKSQGIKTAVNSISSIENAILQIKECRSETEVATLLTSIARGFGVTSYVFVSMRCDESGPQNYRYLIGCSPAWCQMYTEKKWIYIDPFIQYARNNSAPIAGTSIKASTAGQRELLAAAAENGFRSGVVIPAHAGNSKRVGALYFGSDQPPEEIEPVLMQRRMQLRAVAMELFEWWEAWIRAEVIAKLKFKDIDVVLLKLVHEGFTAEEIARMLDITRANIHVKLRRLNYKLEVHSKKHAAEKAIQLGILNV